MAESKLSILVNAIGAAKAAKELKGVDRAISNIGGRAGAGLRTAGDNLKRLGTMAAGAAAVGIGATVKLAADFDAAMTESLAIVQGVTPKIRSDMEKIARDTSKRLNVGADEAARSYFYLASAGFDAAQQMAAMPKVLTFAKAGAFDAATATDLLTDAQSALGLTVRDDVTKNMENLVRVSDVLVRANTLANTSVQQISEALTTKAGAAARNLGKDVEEAAAVLAAFADQGVKGAQAGDALNIVWRDLQRAALKNEDEFKDFKVRVFDANGEMRNTAAIISDLEKALAGMSDKQKRATLTTLGFQDKSVSNLLTLLGTSEAIRTYEKELRSAGGATEEVANKQLQSMSEQFGILRRYVEDAGITIGSKLIPKLVPLAKRMVAFLDAHQGDIERFGDNVASAFDKGLEIASKIPWGTIGQGLQTAASWAGKLIDVFLAMPPQAQQALIAIAGLNKLSGGAISGIVGELGKGLIKGVLGMTAGVVNLKAGALRGGGLGAGAAGAAGAGKAGLSGLSKVFLVGEAIGLAAWVIDTKNEIAENTKQTSKELTDQTQRWIGENKLSTSELSTGLAAVEKGIADIKSNPLLGLVGGDDAVKELEKQREQILLEMNRQDETMERGLRDTVGAIRGIRIPSPRVSVTVNTSVTTRAIQTAQTATQRYGSKTDVILGLT